MKLRFRDHGASILEMVMAIGILGCAALASTTFLSQLSQSKKTTEMDSDVWGIFQQVQSILFENMTHVINESVIIPTDPSPAFVQCKVSKDYFRRADPRVGYLGVAKALQSALISQGTVLTQFPITMTLFNEVPKTAEEAKLFPTRFTSATATESAANCAKFAPESAWKDLSRQQSMYACFRIKQRRGATTSSTVFDRYYVIADIRYVFMDQGLGEPVTCLQYGDLAKKPVPPDSPSDFRRAASMFVSIYAIPKKGGEPGVEWHNVITGRTWDL